MRRCNAGRGSGREGGRAGGVGRRQRSASGLDVRRQAVADVGEPGRSLALAWPPKRQQTEKRDEHAGHGAHPEARAPASAITQPMIGPPIGVEPWKATNQSDMTLPRIVGVDVS